MQVFGQVLACEARYITVYDWIHQFGQKLETFKENTAKLRKFQIYGLATRPMVGVSCSEGTFTVPLRLTLLE